MKRTALLVALLLPAAVACHEDEPVRVAVVVPLSGPAAVYGQAVEHGVSLAAGELQKAHEGGSFPFAIELRVVDSEGRPDIAARRLSELYRQGADAAIGGVTDAEAVAMARVADREKRVLVSTAASSREVSGSSRYVFRLFPTGERESSKMGSFAHLQLDLSEVVILRPEGRFSRELAETFRDEFERQGGKVLDTFVYPEVGGDVSAAVGRVREVSPPAVYIAGTGRGVERLVTGLEKAGYRGVIMTTSAFASPRVIAAAGPAAEGVVLSQGAFEPASDDPRVHAFVEAYRSKYGALPGVFAAYGFDSLQTLGQALRREGRNPRGLWEGLRGLDGFKGVTGFIQFDGHGDVGQYPRVYVVEHGRLESYQHLLDLKRRRLALLDRRMAALRGGS